MMATGSLPLFLILAACVLCSRQSVALSSNAEIAYVIDPFDAASNSLFSSAYGNQGAVTLTPTGKDGAAFGKNAIQVDYQVVQTEEWGGYVDFGTVASRSHNCDGATHVSLWYKVRKPQSASWRSHLRLILLDDSDCKSPANCTDPLELEQYYSFQYILDGSESVWREIRVELRGDDSSESPLRLPGWTGATGNRVLDAAHIRGWRIEISIDSQGDIGSNSAGSIVFDQLACVGGGDLFGAAFRIPNTNLSDAVASSKWAESRSTSLGSNNLTTAAFSNETLTFNFTMNQLAGWTEHVNLTYTAPDRAYYNLSQVASTSLEYNTKGALSVGNTTIRMLLMDASRCTVGGHVNPGKGLQQYSALAMQLTDTSLSGNLTVEIREEAPCWGSTSQPTIFDASVVKGFGFSVAAKGLETSGFGVGGQVTLSKLMALMKKEDTTHGDEARDESTCIVEPDFQFDTEQPGVRRVEFASNHCCQICDLDKDCNYALSVGDHCYMASRLHSNATGRIGSAVSPEMTQAFWMDDKRKRGDFCTRCECRMQERTIDCRGKDLTILPKTFTPDDGPWSPVALDLRDNPSLVLVGTTALASISSTLQELRLPSEMRHLSQDCLQHLPALKSVDFEPDHGAGLVAATLDSESRNVITESAGFFGHVCCEPGTRIDSGLTFCNMTQSGPGIDAIYEPFIDYFGGQALATLKESSSFMAEASESVEKCAEYCAILDGCRFFKFDSRRKSELACRLLETTGTPTKVCCEADDYADINRTKPGWVSGRVAKTRNELDNARVVVSFNHAAMSKENNYTAQLDFVLGSMPLRGAVWIKPVLAADTKLNITFSPRRVALYDNFSTATVLVKVETPEEAIQSQTIHLTTEVESCDTAFASFDILAADRMVDIDVVHASPSSIIVPAFLLSFAVVFLVTVAFLYVDHKKRRSDSVWIIQPSELSYRDPPEVLGRGTFGLVVLAEYRGTQVAVKRVLPSRGTLSPTSSGDGTLSDIQANFQRSGSLTWRSSLGRSRQTEKQLKTEFIAEMRLLSKLRHPCITTVMGAVIGRNEEPLLIMEYMDHGSLYDLLHNETMIIEGESILPILRDIAQGLRFLHAATPQVIHGDLKAQNILVDNKFRSKVADFGLSQKKRLGVTGTPFWMAPELLTGTSTNSAATDVYSFGIILYELYSRKDPYEGEDPLEVLKLVADPVINKRPPVPASCPSEIQSLMAECFSRQPELRPTFKELDVRLKTYDVSTVEPGETRASAQFKKERRTSTLLSDVFPEHIAEALRDGRKVEPEAREMVTIFFSDIVGFTTLCEGMPPIKISDMLDRLYSKFDELSHEHDVFKVETIGDAYMAVTNLVKDQVDHTKRIAEFSVAAIAAANETLVDLDDPDRGFVSIRVGFHSGPVVANVVGSRNPRYCLFGDAVNTAARMESNSVENRIHCSEAAAKLLQAQHPTMPIFSRGKIMVKGKGELSTYWVHQDHVVPEAYMSLEELAAAQRIQQLAGSGKAPLKGRLVGRPLLRRTRTPDFAQRRLRGNDSADKRMFQSKRSLVHSDCSSVSGDWIETCSTDEEAGPS